MRSGESGPPIVVHLVHGTWPAGGLLRHRYPHIFTPRPTWFGAGSDFRSAMEEAVPGIEWRPFAWSGENSEFERRKASGLFRDVLACEIDAAPDACHLVIAHSHGGNVALWALGQLDEPRRDTVAGLATMGTPFLHFSPRTLLPLEARYLGLVLDGRWIALLLLSILPTVLLTLVLDPPHFEFRPAATYAALTGLGAYAYVRWRGRHARARGEQERTPIWPERLHSFIAFRSRKDEASRVIAAADIAASSFTWGWAIVRRWATLMPWDHRAWRRRACGGMLIATFVLVAATMVQALIAPARFSAFVGGMAREFAGLSFLAAWPDWRGLLVMLLLLFPLLVAQVVVSVAFLPIVIALAIIVYSQVFLGLAFGTDTFHMAIATEIAAEAHPPRPAPTLEHVEPVEGRLHHSVYDVPVARTRLAAWIRERQSAAQAASS